VWKAWAFFKRDLRVDLTYKFSFAVQGVHVLLMIASYYFLARFVGEKLRAGTVRSRSWPSGLPSTAT